MKERVKDKKAVR